MDADRRRASRTPCHIGAQITPLASRDAILSYALELLASGALIRSLRPLPTGTRVELALSATARPSVTVHGEIVRSSASNGHHELGVRFDAAAVKPIHALLPGLCD